MKRKCEYQRGGYCVFHGRKGERIFEPSWVTSTGPDGRKVKKYKRKYHYVCEHRGGMIQPRLSFMKTTPKTDDSVRLRARDNIPDDLLTSTEGQRESSYTDKAGQVVDEKRKDLIDEKD